jgi:hypothetical protein
LRFVAADFRGYYFPAWHVDINVKPDRALSRSGATTLSDATLSGPMVVADKDGTMTVSPTANLSAG